MSHHSTSKPLVREVARYLPPHIAPWLDEWELLPGDPLHDTLKHAVTSEVDYVVVFIDSRALDSSWVRSEIDWARAEESRVSRTFVLPVVLDPQVLEAEPWLQERLHIRLHGYAESNLRELASDLSSHLFALVSRDLSNLRSGPRDATGRLREVDRADALLNEVGKRIRTEVFPYRRDHPLTLRELAQRLSTTNDGIRSVSELRDVLYKLRDRRLLSGIGVTANAIYVSEEHLNWRQHEAMYEKRVAAEYVVDLIPDDASIYLDAGTSTLEVAKGIAQGLRFGQWHHLTVTTIAVPIANLFTDLSLELGMEDDDNRLDVHVLGGRMRLNTAALIAEAEAILSHKFDVAVIGTNGVTCAYGLTTTMPSEARLKTAALQASDTALVIAEPAKYGVWQSESFATVDDEIQLITACRPSEAPRVKDFTEEIAGRAMRVTAIEVDETE